MKIMRMILLASGLLLLGGLLVLPAEGSELTWDGVRTPPERVILPPRPIPRMHVTLDVLVDGSTVRLIPYQGRLYLPVPRMGAEYQVRVTNHGGRRIAAIVSVDGLSVIHGKPASEAQAGYVVDPHSSIVIKGWRRDRDTVAAFTFTDRDQSYAARMGYPENVGVIGLVAIEEEGPRPMPIPLLDRKTETAPGAKRAEGGFGGTGTGWGRDLESRIYYVPFVRSQNKQAVTIYYDTVENLRRAGVPVEIHYPVPFPRDPDYCPPPPLR